MEPLPLLLAFVAFPIFFTAIWVGVSFLLSLLSGWNALGRQYRERTPFVGERWQMVSARFRNQVRYRTVLNVGANADGIALGVLFLFRIGHAPLFIPWSEISVAKKRFFFTDAIRIGFEAEPTVKMLLSFQMATKILAYAPAELQKVLAAEG